MAQFRSPQLLHRHFHANLRLCLAVQLGLHWGRVVKRIRILQMYTMEHALFLRKRSSGAAIGLQSTRTHCALCCSGVNAMQAHYRDGPTSTEFNLRVWTLSSCFCRQCISQISHSLSYWNFVKDSVRCKSSVPSLEIVIILRELQ